MKKYLFVFILFFSSFSSALPPTHDTVTLTLSKAEKIADCPAALINAPVVIEYDYNFVRDWGQAYLRKICSKSWNVDLFPLGISGTYGFMSNIPPTEILVAKEKVVIYRIVFDISPSGRSEVMMMVGPEGNCIMGSAGANFAKLRQ